MAGSLQIKHGTKIQVAYDVPPGQQPQKSEAKRS